MIKMWFTYSKLITYSNWFYMFNSVFQQIDSFMEPHHKQDIEHFHYLQKFSPVPQTI